MKQYKPSKKRQIEHAIAGKQRDSWVNEFWSIVCNYRVNHVICVKFQIWMVFIADFNAILCSNFSDDCFSVERFGKILSWIYLRVAVVAYADNGRRC